MHIRKGVDWNTKPARQVTAADFVREFKMLCNPASPVGAPGYYTNTIVGMKAYCAGFAKVKPTAAAIDAYAAGHSLAGVAAKGPLTVTFHLMSPASDFLNILALGFSSARPVEYNKYVPDSAQLRAHTLSDAAVRDHQLQRDPLDLARAQPGVEGVHRPVGQGVCQQHQDHRGADRGQRPAAAAGRHRRHGVGRPAPRAVASRAAVIA